ncbi:MULTISPECIES: NADP-dependent oxidoreductase [Paenibacillus]|uniref:NADP-dependent oxidoreductase n=1 Tax=Paenibacillus TaxID=44249 RepID=UPI0022B8F927|nr:NADP-dependent oxidoreductase [Paenibacillus caseinilyticus]MCZ8522104.1 NADP-dependent oxidoreductase [Paenibacillus caseinilyticus]
MPVNQQILLASRPEGMPSEKHFLYRESSLPVPGDGEALIRTLYLSVDPYMRGRMSGRKSYIPPFAVGEMISGGIVARVESSRTTELQEGDLVLGNLGWQRYGVVKPSQVNKLDPSLAPVTTALGILGMPGLTAYFGLLDIGRPKSGETVVVSGAAGAVGMIVGQIAKLHGARVIGIAGSDEKNRYLVEELGFDAALNYRTQPDLRAALEEACPQGVDVYFDNVGGSVSDAVLSLLNHGARVPLCGQISLYNLEQPDVGPRMQTALLISSALMKGFIVTDYASRFPEGIKALAGWLKEGRLKYAENIIVGFENVPAAFLGLFSGDNLGKQLVKVSD